MVRWLGLQFQGREVFLFKLFLCLTFWAVRWYVPLPAIVPTIAR
jgi:hypothetical protein